MAWGKTEDEKQEHRDAKAATAYAASPVGQAEAARANGEAFFQVEISVARLMGSSVLGSSRGGVKHTGGRPVRHSARSSSLA